jgi:hypothetical protein
MYIGDEPLQTGFFATERVAEEARLRLDEYAKKNKIKAHYTYKPVTVRSSDNFVIYKLNPMPSEVPTSRGNGTGSYHAGASCMKNGFKTHDYQLSPSGRTLKCSRCSSVKGVKKQ